MANQLPAVIVPVVEPVSESRFVGRFDATLVPEMI
jgi:hypothetical protein